MSITETWLSTDEADDTAGSIRHALLCHDNVGRDPHAWKWLALAIHSALQGGCVCHLVTTASPVGAVYPKNAAEFVKYFEDSRFDPNARPPVARLMALPDLLKAVRKPHSAGDRSNEIGVSISDAELTWLRSFHTTVRNQFVHFEPIGLVIGGIWSARDRRPDGKDPKRDCEHGLGFSTQGSQVARSVQSRPRTTNFYRLAAR